MAAFAYQWLEWPDNDVLISRGSTFASCINGLCPGTIGAVPPNYRERLPYTAHEVDCLCSQIADAD